MRTIILAVLLVAAMSANATIDLHPSNVSVTPAIDAGCAISCGIAVFSANAGTNCTSTTN